MSLVYLAGPITGLTFAGCTNWRNEAKRVLGEAGITGLSPMRAKDYLAEDTNIQRAGYAQFALSTPQAIVARDRWDCSRADLVLFNFLGAKDVSIGTCIEVGWADAFRNPSILVIEPDANIHDHAMIQAICGWRASSLAEELELAKAILLP